MLDQLEDLRKRLDHFSQEESHTQCVEEEKSKIQAEFATGGNSREFHDSAGEGTGYQTDDDAARRGSTEDDERHFQSGQKRALQFLKIDTDPQEDGLGSIEVDERDGPHDVGNALGGVLHILSGMHGCVIGGVEHVFGTSNGAPNRILEAIYPGIGRRMAGTIAAVGCCRLGGLSLPADWRIGLRMCVGNRHRLMVR